MKILKIVSLLLLLLFLQSCHTDTIYQQTKSFKEECWHKDSLLTFNVEIKDTQQIYRLLFDTRINGKYNYSNLFLFLTTNFPNTEKTTDTLEFLLALPNGKWLGKGFGNIWSYSIPFRQYVKFPFSGNYSFTIEQGMRTEQLEHILDAGISIEKVNF